jgi:hypothetical protein
MTGCRSHPGAGDGAGDHVEGLAESRAWQLEVRLRAGVEWAGHPGVGDQVAAVVPGCRDEAHCPPDVLVDQAGQVAAHRLGGGRKGLVRGVDGPGVPAGERCGGWTPATILSMFTRSSDGG